jgi:hypothetical protein
MLSQADFSLSLYAAWLGSDADVVLSALDPVIAKLKTKPVIDGSSCELVANFLKRKFI